MTIFKDNTENKRYELEIDGQIAFAKYAKDSQVVTIFHVETPPQLRGGGVAGKLMEQVVKEARAGGLKIKPECGYAALWMRRHPENNDILT